MNFSSVKVVELLVVFIVEFIFLFFFVRFLIGFLKSKNAVQHVREELIDEHKKKEGTPRGGGIVFLVAPLFILPFFHSKEVLFVVISLFIFGLIGLIDDILTFRKKSSEGLPIRYKLIIYTFASILLYFIFRDIFTPTLCFFGLKFSVSYIVYFALFLVMMLGSTNAFNLTDGVDGLLGSVTSIMLIVFVFIALLNNHIPIAAVSISLLISILAFLWFNAPKASIFMGDLGSGALGGVIAAIAIIEKVELYLPIIAIIPVIEALSIFIQVSYFKITHGKRIFKMSPIHHHFEILGWSEAQVDFRFSAITVIAGIIAILLMLLSL